MSIGLVDEIMKYDPRAKWSPSFRKIQKWGVNFLLCLAFVTLFASIALIFGREKGQENIFSGYQVAFFVSTFVAAVFIVYCLQVEDKAHAKAFKNYLKENTLEFDVWVRLALSSEVPPNLSREALRELNKAEPHWRSKAARDVYINQGHIDLVSRLPQRSSKFKSTENYMFLSFLLMFLFGFATMFEIVNGSVRWSIAWGFVFLFGVRLMWLMAGRYQELGDAWAYEVEKVLSLNDLCRIQSLPEFRHSEYGRAIRKILNKRRPGWSLDKNTPVWAALYPGERN